MLPQNQQDPGNRGNLKNDYNHVLFTEFTFRLEKTPLREILSFIQQNQ